jgi:hypothetical protein
MSTLTHKLDWLVTDFMNYSDMNRIEDNINQVASYIRSFQFKIPTITVKTNRDNTSIDYLADINRVEGNLETIRLNFATPSGYLGAKTWTKTMGFDFNDAIRLEQNTQMLMAAIENLVASFRYCGTIACGEGGIY